MEALFCRIPIYIYPYSMKSNSERAPSKQLRSLTFFTHPLILSSSLFPFTFTFSRFSHSSHTLNFEIFLCFFLLWYRIYMCWPHLDPAPLSNPPPPRDALCKILSWTTVLIQLCQLLYTHPQWNPASSARKQAKAKKKASSWRANGRATAVRNWEITETQKLRNAETENHKPRKRERYAKTNGSWPTTNSNSIQIETILGQKACSVSVQCLTLWLLTWQIHLSMYHISNNSELSTKKTWVLKNMVFKREFGNVIQFSERRCWKYLNSKLLTRSLCNFKTWTSIWQKKSGIRKFLEIERILFEAIKRCILKVYSI